MGIKSFTFTLLLFLSIQTSFGKRDLSIYTTIEVLSEKRIDNDQKKRWVMSNILSLDLYDKSSPPLKGKKEQLYKRPLGKGFRKEIEKERRERNSELKKWEESL